MSTPDIRTTLDEAQAIVERADSPTAARGDIASYVLPEHTAHTARIRVTEWLKGVRTPTSFGVQTRFVEWVRKNRRRKNFTATK